MLRASGGLQGFVDQHRAFEVVVGELRDDQKAAAIALAAKWRFGVETLAVILSTSAAFAVT